MKSNPVKAWTEAESLGFYFSALITQPRDLKQVTLSARASLSRVEINMQDHFSFQYFLIDFWCNILCFLYSTNILMNAYKCCLDCEEIQPVHSVGDQSWVFFGRNDAKAEIPILWPPHAKSWLILKDPDVGRDWGQEKGTTEDEMAGWHHRLNGHAFE